MYTPPVRISTTSLLLLALLWPCRRTTANDSAASIGAGGLVLRDEKRISMRKERLTISPSKIVVEYEFVNESPTDITTEVAFPVPEYQYAFDALEGPFDLGGFRAWVDGAEVKVAKEVRALADGKDHAPALRQLGIDVERHGNYQPDDFEAPGRPNQIRALPPASVDRLVALGLLEPEKPERGWPRWTVAITWHWTQTFPAGRPLRVRHEYQPAVGYRGFSVSGLARFGAEFPDACADDAALGAAARKVAAAKPPRERPDQRWFRVEWVSYILTTAKSWKTPIREFQLIVERPADAIVTFCWDGPVERVGKTRFRATASDFVPTRELAVYFLRSR
jgi:hypothetical protein